MRKPVRLAVVTSHPIQYQGPMFRSFHAHPDVELTALFCTDHGQKPTFDREFNATFQWERPITDGYPHEYVPSIHPNPSPYGFWPCTNPGLWNRLTKDRFDALLLIGWAFASCWIALGAAKAHGLKVLMRGESGLDSYVPRSKGKEILRDAVLSSLFRQIDGFLSIGTGNAELYRAHGIPDDRIFLTPYAVDNDYFLEQSRRVTPRRKELRAALGVDDGRPIVLTSGKLTERKAPLDLLRAFAPVRRETKAKLVYLGDGPLRAEVEAEVRREGLEDDVLITGFKKQTELPDVYGAADVFVFPTRFETWGLVANEAMLFGLPVICTDRVPAHRDLITPGETGEVYPVADIGALTAILRERLNDTDKLAAMGVAAKERITGWNLDRCTEGLVAALDRV